MHTISKIPIIKRKFQNADYHDKFMYSGIKSFNEKYVCVYVYRYVMFRYCWYFITTMWIKIQNITLKYQNYNANQTEFRTSNFC